MGFPGQSWFFIISIPTPLNSQAHTHLCKNAGFEEKINDSLFTCLIISSALILSHLGFIFSYYPHRAAPSVSKMGLGLSWNFPALQPRLHFFLCLPHGSQGKIEEGWDIDDLSSLVIISQFNLTLWIWRMKYCLALRMNEPHQEVISGKLPSLSVTL
jgi:hypothetical protein